MKVLYLFSGIIGLLWIACSGPEPAPPVSADLTGYELEQVPGSEFYKATKVEDSVLVQEGYVLNGMKTGMWLDYTDGKISQVQHFIDGKLNGPSISLDKRMQVTAITGYEDGNYDGLKGTYKFGRPVEEVTYKAGAVDGFMKKYYNNGKLMEETEYKDNNMHGYYRHYNDDGHVDLEYLYRNGKKISGGIVEPLRRKRRKLTNNKKAR